MKFNITSNFQEDHIIDFWKNESKNNIKPNNGLEFPEGWDVRTFLSSFDCNSVIEVGCGYGRLCEAFSPENYLGLDLSSEVISLAKEKNPLYKFETIDWKENYPESELKFVYTVLLHMNDDMVKSMIKNLCDTSEKIIVGEIMGRKWRNEKSYPLCYNREPEEYVKLFEENNFTMVDSVEREYKKYPDTDVTFQNFIKKGK